MGDHDRLETAIIIAWSAHPGPVALPLAEARAALPVDNDYSLEAIFAGMEWKRLRVQQDQQPPEWDGMNLSC